MGGIVDVVVVVVAASAVVVVAAAAAVVVVVVAAVHPMWIFMITQKWTTGKQMAIVGQSCFV